MNIIETENLSYKYDESHFALSDLSIGFEKGKITTILGANGAGKSTLFLNMNGILKPHSGTVKFMGKPIGYSKKCRNSFSRPRRPAFFRVCFSGCVFRCNEFEIAAGRSCSSYRKCT